MSARTRKTVAFVAAIVAFAAALGLGVALFLANAQPWAALLWGLVWGIVVVVTAVAFVGFLRQHHADPGVAAEVVAAPGRPLPPEASGKDQPWPFEWFAPALAETFEGTPYIVRSDGTTVSIHADLADARWQHMATMLGHERTFVTHLTPEKPGLLRRTDESRSVDWQAGVPRLGARLDVQSGRVWTLTRRVDYGLAVDGFRKRIDYFFRTSEINEPLRAVLQRAGWRTALDAEAKGALAVGALGASAIVLVPVGLLVSWLVGG